MEQVENTAKAALHQVQLQAKVLQSVLTPNAALRGSSNLTVDQVLRRRLEFLTTYGVNLIGVQPEPGVVSLSIARPRREVVSLRSLWQRWTPDGEDGNQSVLIGVREDDGKLLVLSPGELHAPHTLIAGSTGSGKSVLMQNIILSVAATNRPSQARIILVDPKQGVDYFAFEDLPQLAALQRACCPGGSAVHPMADPRRVRRVDAHRRVQAGSRLRRSAVGSQGTCGSLVFAAQRPEVNVMIRNGG